MASRESNRSILICHVNCQSLYAHFDEFKLFFNNSRYHIICLSETWLKPNLPDSMINLSGYTLYRQDRVGKGGGGVAFYVHNSLNVNILRTSDAVYCRKPEFIIAEIASLGSANLLLAVVYRPPNHGFLQEFEDIFLDLQTGYRHSIVFGDFNADMLAASHDSIQLSTFVGSSGLYLVPFQATHNLLHSRTLLDLCIIDDPGKLINFGQHAVPFLSAHDLIYINYQLYVERICDRLVTCRNFRQFNKDVFLQDIQLIDWSSLTSSTSLDEKVDIFNTNLLDCLNRHAPLQRICFKSLPAPWLTVDIKNAMRERNRAHRRWRRNGEDGLYRIYKRLRNDVQTSVRTAKSNYYTSLFTRVKNPTLVWNELRHLGLIKTRDLNRGLSHSVDVLNDFFVHAAGGSGSAMTSSPPNLSSDALDDSQFYWRHVAPSAINRAFTRIRTNATGVDGISSGVIKLILPHVMSVIEHVFNSSLTCGVFPSGWKFSIICPVAKIRNPTLPQHYRPIAILPAMSKAFERVICEQIQDYLEESHLYDSHQFAYRRGHSTQSSIVRLMDDARCAADRRMVTIAVFFDLSKAFDRVQHHILLQKLESLNFSCLVLRWIASYLQNRTQAVKNPSNSTLSLPALIDVGVPQGSVLGPLLFTLYLCDLGGTLSHCKYSLYADDLLIYFHCDPHNLLHGVECVNLDIKNIIRWASLNQLLFNPDKTQATIMGSARFLNAIHQQQLPNIIVNDTSVHYVTDIKYLGVTISNTLSWDKHITSTTSKIRRTLYQLRLCGNLFPRELRKKLIITLIYPHLDYCCCALTSVTAEQNLRLQRAINACIRFIFNIRRDVYITPYYNSLRWLKVSERRKYFVGCLVHTILATHKPDLIFANLQLRGPSVRNTRAVEADLIPPLCRTEIFRHSFLSTAAQVWNSIPLNVRKINSIGLFKSKLYEYLLDG